MKDLNLVDSDMVKAPILADCPVNVELSVVDSIMTVLMKCLLVK